MDRKFEYETILIKGAQNGVFAEFPFESAKEFGTRKAVSVKAVFDGETYFMSLLPTGNGTHWLHVKKDIRLAIGKDEGDSVKIVVEKDESPKTMEMPEYLQWLLENDLKMMGAFHKLSFSAKKFWTGFVSEPKTDDAKVKRINRLFEVLRENNKSSKDK
ncbi:MAG: DUF1905 domain-containing protein [Prolixibacteraceae bacterium]|jgi:hypothetical protein|nr:DUF1905 domain-containing protein [Prolixibacteraceae bacterium]MBT6006155.1 DUF1905 domain-containing protein [Prolixibacteraceae bacterium]MBT6766874.1 DUF1905 domain-containing protein [Prolixibacteraceae bacterium]MBT6999936.1 DUF1905 domain-containing protein [Prolixibacteraceae bacterium]MBT7393580.1 DUF1905 domain-containing protein [Prolixibacteraceae bacterium]